MANWHLGALVAAGHAANPERFVHASHSARELMDNLHRILDVPVRALRGDSPSVALNDVRSACDHVRMDTASLDAIDPTARELFEAARAVSVHAYAPYSRLRVGAAVRTERGGVFLGCNIENASYGLTCCAERNAVFAAVAAEGEQMRLQCVAIHADAHTGSPCGACRQVLAEFGFDARVLFTSADSNTDATVAELLPVAFALNPAPPVF